MSVFFSLFNKISCIFLKNGRKECLFLYRLEKLACKAPPPLKSCYEVRRQMIHFDVINWYSSHYNFSIYWSIFVIDIPYCYKFHKEENQHEMDPKKTKRFTLMVLLYSFVFFQGDWILTKEATRLKLVSLESLLKTKTKTIKTSRV